MLCIMRNENACINPYVPHWFRPQAMHYQRLCIIRSCIMRILTAVAIEGTALGALSLFNKLFPHLLHHLHWPACLQQLRGIHVEVTWPSITGTWSLLPGCRWVESGRVGIEIMQQIGGYMSGWNKQALERLSCLILGFCLCLCPCGREVKVV